MQKEIFEQPRAVSTRSKRRLDHAGAFRRRAEAVLRAERESVLILACGTSYTRAGRARYWIESSPEFPCNVEIASEYRYRTSVPTRRR